MYLGSISQEFLQQVETVTGLPVNVEADERLQSLMLARVQIARRGVPLHRVVYYPSTGAMADNLIAFQCSFVLRLHSQPTPERFDLANAEGAQPDPMNWVRAHAASAHLIPGWQRAFVAPSINDSD